MNTPFGHLTYCTNIHGGESWETHFGLLKTHVPVIKEAIASDTSFGIGLRLADRASRTLSDANQLAEFQDWLDSVNGYVFTMNGFPFGAFHGEPVKAKVHAPDWSTPERLAYTQRLFALLAQLVPDGLDGGVSTSPLGYRHGLTDSGQSWSIMRTKATQHIIEIADQLIQIRLDTGKILHLDIEPEPDGVLESSPEFIEWYLNELLPTGITILTDRYGISRTHAEEAIRDHIRLCYDVCHFALGYEDHQAVIRSLEASGIRVGKFQLSAAIKADMPADPRVREHLGEAFMAFDEPTYLHQVIARQHHGGLIRFRDLPEARSALFDYDTVEWRSHFHVPVFTADLGTLTSTQSDLMAVLRLQQDNRRTNHLEVETYTWGVLPPSLQLPVAESIARELNWVKIQLEN